jgi:hypothetical protein
MEAIGGDRLDHLHLAAESPGSLKSVLFGELCRRGEGFGPRGFDVGLDTDRLPALHRIGIVGARHVLNADAKMVVDNRL